VILYGEQDISVWILNKDRFVHISIEWIFSRGVWGFGAKVVYRVVSVEKVSPKPLSPRTFKKMMCNSTSDSRLNMLLSFFYYYFPIVWAGMTVALIYSTAVPTPTQSDLQSYPAPRHIVAPSLPPSPVSPHQRCSLRGES